MRRNADARAGDAIILTKAIGVGVYSAAIKKGDALRCRLRGDDRLHDAVEPYRRGSRRRTRHVHAITDVTGFGLLGHGLEMARGSSLDRTIRFRTCRSSARPNGLPRQGLVTGASKRNWAELWRVGRSCRPILRNGSSHLLTDPQTSGGLLIACDPERLRADPCARLSRPVIPRPGSSGRSRMAGRMSGSPSILMRPSLDRWLLPGDLFDHHAAPPFIEEMAFIQHEPVVIELRLELAAAAGARSDCRAMAHQGRRHRKKCRTIPIDARAGKQDGDLAPINFGSDHIEVCRAERHHLGSPMSTRITSAVNAPCAANSAAIQWSNSVACRRF